MAKPVAIKTSKKYHQNVNRADNFRQRLWRTRSRELSVLLLIIVLASGYFLYKSFASGVPLSLYYPDNSLYKTGYYLEGNNYAKTAASRSVLWFQSQPDGSFRQYNSAPPETCHWDQLSWKTGTLVYSKTHDQCGTNNNETVYSPGIQFMPNRWDSGQNWAVKGSSATHYYNGGKVVCTGVNSWTSRVVGWEQIAPGLPGLHIQNNQSTLWTSGSDPSGCAAGYTTKWQENFYLIATLPVKDATVNGQTKVSYALKREVGGNIDSYNQTGKWDYDVWFDSWNRLK